MNAFHPVSLVHLGVFCVSMQKLIDKYIFTAILYHVKIIKKQLLFFNLKVQSHQKNMITSTETTSPENFTLAASPVLRLLTRKEFVKYGNS